MIETLKALCKLSGPSGFESDVREYLRAQAEPCADHVVEDATGNLIVFKKGRVHVKNPPLLCAHMDEVGLLVCRADDNGFLKFSFIGGVDARVAPGKAVVLGPSAVPGVIGLKPVHLTTDDEAKQAPKAKDLYIDIGAASREEAERLIPPGTWGTFAGDVIVQNHYIKAKALDDRIGCAILLSILREELPVDTWFAFTVQEEVGCRGAFGAAFAIQPQTAIVFEGTTAADIPGKSGAERICRCGAGPAISLLDNSSLADPKLFAELRAVAEEAGIPWQVKTRSAGGNDAGPTQRAAGGCRTCVISVPVRYLHSASSLACLWDAANARLLAQKYLQSLEV